MNNFDNSRKTKPMQTSVKTNLDDWETDPDFVSDMDEMHQRWGSKHRTVGSINMNELIDEVRKDHQSMREKLNHSSQRDYSGGFGGKFGIQHDRKDKSALDYDYHEQLSKHSSQEIKREIITSSSSSSSIIKGGNQSIVSDAKKSFLEKTTENSYHEKPSMPSNARPSDVYNSKPKVSVKTFLQDNDRSYPTTTRTTSPPTIPSKQTFMEKDNYSVPNKFEESSITKRILKEEKKSTSSSSTTSTKNPIDVSPAFKSIQEKIDAFKREFEDIENKVAKKSELSKVIGKTTKFDKSHSNVEYVSRNSPTQYSTTTASVKPATTYVKSTSSSNVSSQPKGFPAKTNIKSLSERFETLGREDSEDFKRRTEVRRKEFFDQIKNQVRETRKELDGFDPIDEDDYDDVCNRRQNVGSKAQTSDGSSERLSKLTTSSQQKHAYSGNDSKQEQRFNSSPISPQSTSRPSSRLSSDSQASTIKPKVYTKRETTEERIISKIVKENDKIIEDETKRDVKRSSSFHGSSDDEQNEQVDYGEGPKSIRIIKQNLESSPVIRTESPVDRVKRENPVVETELIGAGLMARTLYDYQAVESDELTFDVDDLITNIEKVDVGWYKGTISYKNGDKQTGLFPANYVKLLNDNHGEY